MNRTLRAAAVGGLAACALAGGEARASSFLAMDLDQLVAQSDAVVVAEVLDTHSFWDKDHRVILTEATLAVDERLLGNPPRILTVTTFGGTVDDYTVVAHGFPSFADGERVAVFLERHPDGTLRVTGYQLGLYDVEDADGDTIVVPTLDSGTRLVRPNGEPMPAPTTRDLQTFRDDVRRAAAREEAP
ncbi:MAG: hypothetical protein R3F59_28025 [Myxococcota bacterium]